MIEASGTSTLALPSSQLDLRVELVPIHDLTDDLLYAWSDLNQRQRHANAFYQPQYLIPLWRHGCFETLPDILIVRDQTNRLMGLTLMQARSYGPRLPFPHLDSIQHDYLFCGDMLIDREHREQVVRTMFHWLSTGRYRHGLRIQETTHAQSAPSLKPMVAKEMGLQRFIEREWERAAVIPECSIREFLQTHCSKSRRKSINRSYKKLTQSGPVSFSLVHGPQITTQHIVNFLKLEKMGWKGEAGTALASTPGDSQFFYEMCRQMSAAHKLVFGELKVGSQVIASTCNLIDNNVLFAFKVGWNPEFTAGSPGVWSELELMQAIGNELPNITLIDSCAQPGSHLDDLWPERITCTRSCYVQSRRSKIVHYTRKTVRQVRQKLMAFA